MTGKMDAAALSNCPRDASTCWRAFRISTFLSLATWTTFCKSMASISLYIGRTWELSSLSASADGWVRGITSGAACSGLGGAVAQPAARHDTQSAMPRVNDFDDVMDPSTLGIPVGHRPLNQGPRWRRALDGRHHRRIVREARG